MTASRYVLRSAAFAVVHLAVFLAGAAIPWFPLPALAVAAVWLTAQGAYGRRRFDVIMLATTAMVGATLNGAGLMTCFVVAILSVIPALLFTVLLERRLPGYWQGHGDRFRRPRAALGRLAGIAALTAAAGIVLEAVANTTVDPAPAAVRFAVDTTVLVLAPLAVRASRRSRTPGSPGSGSSGAVGSTGRESGRPRLTVIR